MRQFKSKQFSLRRFKFELLSKLRPEIRPIIIPSLLGFLLPIILGFFLAPRLFPLASKLRAEKQSQKPESAQEVSKRGALAFNSDPVSKGNEAVENQAVENQVSAETEEAEPKLLKVASDQALDPVAGGNFLVSFYVRFDSFPRSGKRQKIVAKYNLKDAGSPGWAIAIKKLSTSIRPELYLRPTIAPSAEVKTQSNEGWFTFDRVNFDTDKWYAMTAIMREREFVALYLEEFPNLIQPVDAEALVNQGSLRFIGGYSAADFSLPQTAADLELAARNSDWGELRSFMLASVEKIPSNQARLMELIKGGPLALASKLKAGEIKLWLKDGKKDYSPYARLLTEG